MFIDVPSLKNHKKCPADNNFPREPFFTNKTSTAIRSTRGPPLIFQSNIERFTPAYSLTLRIGRNSHNYQRKNQNHERSAVQQRRRQWHPHPTNQKSSLNRRSFVVVPITISPTGRGGPHNEVRNCKYGWIDVTGRLGTWVAASSSLFWDVGGITGESQLVVPL